MNFDSSDLRNMAEKACDTMVEMGKNLRETTKTVIDVTPLTLKLKEKESYLEKQYFELGILYYQEHEHDENPEFEQMGRISAIREEIKEVRRQIAEVRGKETCPGCGEFVEKGHIFCPHCGMKIKL
ncbi:MAG: zinc ribbon domain-containing protein [Lachnospiraceae bacterium]|nr:zinc ribbon domain-containing protein [Lachnospiraceae bacterium]